MTSPLLSFMPQSYGAMPQSSSNPLAGLGGLNTSSLLSGLGLGSMSAGTTDPLAGLFGTSSLTSGLGIGSMSADPLAGLLGLTGQQASPTQSLFQGQSVGNDPVEGMTQMLGQMMMMLLQLLGTTQQANDQGPSLSTLDNQLAQAALAAFEQAQAQSQAQQAQSQSFVSPTIQTAKPLASSVPANNIPGIKNLSTGTAGTELNRSLNAVASDSEGAKLIAAAKAKGITIEVGDPAKAAGANDKASVCSCPTHQAAAKDGTSTVNGVTITQPDGSIKIVVRDPNNIKTIAHELVHAVSSQDGDSKEEEGIADVIGSRIANRIGGSAVGGLNGTDQQIFLNKQQYYPGLIQNNAIRSSLASLGISAGV